MRKSSAIASLAKLSAFYVGVGVGVDVISGERR